MKVPKILGVAAAVFMISFMPRIISHAPEPTQASVSEGWKKNNIGWWYVNPDGSYTVSNWQKINNTWYYFNSSGYMHTGWLLDKGKWYYLNSDGSMRTGWLSDKNKWYYLNSDGSMRTGWLSDKNKWYYLNSDGSMRTGWLSDKNKWYYLKSDGAMQTGWILDNGKWYYLHSDGSMAVNTTIDGYYVDSSGVWIPSTSGNTSVGSISSNVSRDWTEIKSLSDSIYNQYYSEITAMLAGLNQIRAEAGKSALVLDEALTKSSIARGIHMISYGYFSHYYNGELHINVTNQLYNVNAMAENIAYTTKTSNTGATLNQNWKGSEGHYKNMIGNYTKVGIAYVPNDKNQIYGVQLFR